MKTFAILSLFGLLGLGALAVGRRKRASAPDLEALVDSVWVFGVTGDAQTARVLRTFEHHGQVLSQTYDGSTLGVKARMPRRWTNFPTSGTLAKEIDVGLQILTGPGV